MQITWYGNASLLIQGTSSAPILLDPFLGLPGAQYRPSPAIFHVAESIFLTHGHLDHASSVPKLVASRHFPPTVYCTRSPLEVLQRHGVPESCFIRITPPQTVALSGIQVTAWPCAHVRYDRTLIRKIAFNWRILRYGFNLLPLAFLSRNYREKQETVAYQINADGQQVLVLGSLNLAKGIPYPQDVDLLVLPYQGCSHLLSAALPLVKQLSPRAVLLDHMDDAFPPVSYRIDPTPFLQVMGQRYPQIPVLVPSYGQPIELPTWGKTR